MKTAQEISNELAYFTGTENYYRWSLLFKNVVLTDGAKYLAETANAFWLMDLISSHLPSYKHEGFAVAKLQLDPDGSGCTVRIEDGNDNVLASQHVEYTDFPLDSINLYVIPQGDLWVIMLPSEY